MGRSQSHHCCGAVAGLVRLFELLVPVLLSADAGSPHIDSVIKAISLFNVAEKQQKKSGKNKPQTSGNLKPLKQNAKDKAKTPTDNLKSQKQNAKDKAKTPPPAKEKAKTPVKEKTSKPSSSGLRTSLETKVTRSSSPPPAKEKAQTPDKEKSKQPASARAKNGTVKETTAEPSTDKAKSQTPAPSLVPVLAPVPLPDFGPQESEFSKKFPFLSAKEVYLCCRQANETLLGRMRTAERPSGLTKREVGEWNKAHPTFFYLHRLFPDLPDRYNAPQMKTENNQTPQPSSQAKGKQPEGIKNDKVKSVSTAGTTQPVTSPAVAKASKSAIPTPLSLGAKVKESLDKEIYDYYLCMSRAEQLILCQAPNPLGSLADMWAVSQH